MFSYTKTAAHFILQSINSFTALRILFPLNSIVHIRHQEDILQRAVSTLEGGLDDEVIVSDPLTQSIDNFDLKNFNDSKSVHHLLDEAHSHLLDFNENGNEKMEIKGYNEEAEVVSMREEVGVKKISKSSILRPQELPKSVTPENYEAQSDIKEEKQKTEESLHKYLKDKENLKDSASLQKIIEKGITETNKVPVSNDDIKPEYVKFSDLLKWENGVGKLNGSDLKFKMNEFDAVEIVEDKDLENIKSHQNKKASANSMSSATPRHHARKPNYRDMVKDEEIFSDNSQDSEPQGNKSSKESYDICCCKNCGCYGLSSEFFRESSFCSIACGEVSVNDYHANIFIKLNNLVISHKAHSCFFI